MSRFSMGTKFTMIASIIFVFLVALMVIKSKSTDLADSFNRFYNENHKVSVSLEHLKEAQVDIVLNVRGLQIGYLLSLDKQIPPYLKTIDEAYRNTPVLLQNLKTGFSGDAQALKNVESLVADFQTKTKAFVSAMQNAPDHKAPFPVFSAFMGSYTALIDALDAFSDLNSSAVIVAKQNSDSLISEIEISFWGAVALALFVSLALSYAISSSIVRRIQVVSTAAQEMAKGHLNRPVEVVGEDEIADLGRAINVSREHFRSVITNVLNAVDGVNKSSLGVLQANQEAAKRSVDIMEHTELVVVALEQMSASSRSISENTQDSSSAANGIRTVAQSSLAVAHNTLSETDNLVSTLNETNVAVTELRSETNNIETILGVIRGISEQTNLLALNAAIEAARAGETGRGFAVVADEVRALAQRSQDSVNEIEALLTKLNQASQRAVSQMGSSLGLVESSRKHVSEASDLTQDILERIERISEQASQIASSATEQIAVTDDINMKMHSVRDLTQRNAEEAKNSGQSVMNSSEDVKKQLEFFKI
ncbi:methyl-accepting chemotaxis protein [Marinomonas fungiae]|uniref:Methyl-accepting chemotaxis protein n=1 Tax=Marinomonas fungiae TaxID=1137284 RepID=A0A0K6IN42_9GAMM|nr:methyl-accepting chemotaxis protein [Marinomonas fungiae]CUB04519.1 Methyl-accepting chemotaxis protein [Marinomonas fungiae]